MADRAPQARSRQRAGTGAARAAAVVAHGAGSTASFIVAAFGPSLAAAGFELITFDDRSGDPQAVADRMAELVDASGACLVGGVSLGAHAAVLASATRPHLSGALLVMPAWTGPPSQVAALSRASAAQLARGGLTAELARLDADATGPGGARAGPPGWPGWVGVELARAWATYRQDELVSALVAASGSPGPTPAQLSAMAVASCVVAVGDDPFHPVQVARQWAGLLRSVELTELGARELDRGPAALGHAAVQGWLRLRLRTGSPSQAR